MLRIPIVIAISALVVALLGNFEVYKTNHDQIKNLANEAAARRTIIAKTDFILCDKIYSEFDKLERQSLAQTTFAYYKKLLPSLGDQEIHNLVAANRTNISKLIKEFDPIQCNKLPTQKLVK